MFITLNKYVDLFFEPSTPNFIDLYAGNKNGNNRNASIPFNSQQMFFRLHATVSIVTYMNLILLLTFEYSKPKASTDSI